MATSDLGTAVLNACANLVKRASLDAGTTAAITSGMTNTPAILTLLGGLALCVPAFAQPHRPAAKQPTPARAPNCGASYVVGPKDSSSTALSQAQVDAVMKAKLGEVEACWMHLPVEKRKREVAAVLNLSIDDGGEVQTITAPALPDDVQRCIALAAVAWEFPATDAHADALTFAYPIALHAK